MRNPALVNIVAQCLILYISLIIPVGLPLYFGLAAYGEFVQETASAFLIAKILEHPLEALTKYSNESQALLTATSLGLLALVLSILINLTLKIHINIMLLTSMLASAISYSRINSKGLTDYTLKYLIYFASVFTTIILLGMFFQIEIITILIISNILAPAFFLLEKNQNITIPSTPLTNHPSQDDGRTNIFGLLFLGAVSVFISYGISATLSTTISAMELGKIRVYSTIIGFSSFLLLTPPKLLIPKLSSGRTTASEIIKELRPPIYLYFGTVSTSCFITNDIINSYLKILALAAIAAHHIILERLFITNSTRARASTAGVISALLGLSVAITANPEWRAEHIFTASICACHISYAILTILLSDKSAIAQIALSYRVILLSSISALLSITSILW